MKKKMTSLFLTGAILISTLSGCAGSPPDTPPASTGNEPASNAVEAPAPAPSGSDAASGKPEYAEITVEIFDRGTDGGKTDPTNNHYTEWIKKKVLEDENIGVTFIPVSRWEEEPQLNNMMAAGNAPDICITYAISLVEQYRDLGGLFNMAPYVDTILADLNTFLGPDASVPGKNLIERQVVTEANNFINVGDIYSIPGRRVNQAELNTFIRKDWLDKLNLPLPTTLEEYHAALLAFKEKDPGGVGAANVVPFTMTNDVRWRAGTLINSFKDPSLSDKDEWIYDVVSRNFLVPGIKEGYRYMNKMYNEGLIDTEFPLYNDDVTSDNLIKSGVVGSFIHNWDQPFRDTPGLIRDLKVNVPDAEIVAIDPFKDSTGKNYKHLYDQAGANIFIPATCKNPEAALRYLNWISKFENYNYLQIGDEGVTHEMVDGIPKIIPATNEKIQNSSMNIDYTLTINGIDLQDPEKTKKAIATSYPVDSQIVVDALEMALRDGKPTPVRTITLTAAGPYTQTLLDKGKELMSAVVTAAPDQFDAVWDAKIADWLASGAQEIVDERTAKYAE